MSIIFILYIISTWMLGMVLLNKVAKNVPHVLHTIGSFLMGTLVVVPVTYCLSYVFISMGNPIAWGISVTTLVVGIIGTSLMMKSNIKHIIPSDRVQYESLIVFLFSFGISAWLMTKTFHGDTNGQLFVGSNNIFDFSHALGIIRSFSFGSNIPFMSPFQAGLPYFYHFFFTFYVALWEYAGVPIVWAMNIPSIISFTSLLVVIYYLPQRIFGQSKLVGWIAVLLTLTNSTMSWWQLLIQKGISLQTLRSLWVLPTYPFAGPFDGSIISLFMTLNNYVNQRHLAFAMACALLLLMFMVEDIQSKHITSRKILMYGICLGLLGMWNIAITIVAAISVVLLLMLTKSLKNSLLFVGVTAVVVMLWFGQYFLLYSDFIILGKAITGISIYKETVWNAYQYFWMNLGILPVVTGIGFFVIHKKSRVYGLPFILLSIALCLKGVMERQGFDQKFLSFLIIWANVFAAIGIGWIWQKRGLIQKCVAIGIFLLLTISGVIDLIPIKNEFAYPLVDNRMLPVISWIKTNTPKDAIFVFYSDMVDPVAFAGRKNYYGFFGNIGSTDRSEDVKSIYAGDINRANNLGISYVLAPKWTKNDFPYTVDTMYFTERMMTVYEDERYVIYSTTKK